jgi:hypothetical protein
VTSCEFGDEVETIFSQQSRQLQEHQHSDFVNTVKSCTCDMKVHFRLSNMVNEHPPNCYTLNMPISHPSLPKAPAPTKNFFDPFNSSSTGHQRAENTLARSTSWRDSRTYKLAKQLKDSTGRGGTQHLADLVGAGSADFGKDGRNGDWESGAPGLREAGWQDIRGMMRGPRKRSLDEAGNPNALKRYKTISPAAEEGYRPCARTAISAELKDNSKDIPGTISHEANVEDEPESPPKSLPQIFNGLAIYLNGSTAPLVSDHRLKSLFVSHGGNVCLGLARRSVTHVILGETGLASGKIQKEIRKVGGESVRYVTAKWVIDSVEAGRRKSEGPYLPKDLGIGGSRQKSVGDMFSKPKKGG